MDQKRKKEDQQNINKIKDTHAMAEQEEIFNDDGEERVGGKKDPFNEMRETKTGFGANVKKDYAPGQHEAEGGLQPDEDEDEDEEELGEDEEEDDDGEGLDVDDEEEEDNNTNF